VRFLLDVNALLAFGVFEHRFHQRVAGWVYRLEAIGVPDLATCSITELGFVRVLAQSPQFGFNVPEARQLLLELKAGNIPKFTFLDDGHDIATLPDWVVTAKQTTDGHLLQLANANGMLLATLDENIPGAYLIPA